MNFLLISAVLLSAALAQTNFGFGININSGVPPPPPPPPSYPKCNYSCFINGGNCPRPINGYCAPIQPPSYPQNPPPRGPSPSQPHPPPPAPAQPLQQLPQLPQFNLNGLPNMLRSLLGKGPPPKPSVRGGPPPNAGGARIGRQPDTTGSPDLHKKEYNDKSQEASTGESGHDLSDHPETNGHANEKDLNNHESGEQPKDTATEHSLHNDPSSENHNHQNDEHSDQAHPDGKSSDYGHDEHSVTHEHSMNEETLPNNINGRHDDPVEHKNSEDHDTHSLPPQSSRNSQEFTAKDNTLIRVANIKLVTIKAKTMLGKAPTRIIAISTQLGAILLDMATSRLVAISIPLAAMVISIQLAVIFLDMATSRLVVISIPLAVIFLDMATSRLVVISIQLAVIFLDMATSRIVVIHTCMAYTNPQFTETDMTLTKINAKLVIMKSIGLMLGKTTFGIMDIMPNCRHKNNHTLMVDILFRNISIQLDLCRTTTLMGDIMSQPGTGIQRIMNHGKLSIPNHHTEITSCIRLLSNRSYMTHQMETAHTLKA
ncbi:hypothetical protein QR680_013774 [Steinernema hermaphroditum]|uniref:Uncharacterized protein n=1 Tax=Steinernema hermaphroditum TaxID=289476 RepID=A0AA39I6M2_9BILA|nr:hypothetical protein QR680_013774 [Steinernema hermaphroditum]